MIGNIIGWCVFGLIVGAIVRALSPNDNVQGCLPTIAVGVGGSFTGGMIWYLLFGSEEVGIQPSGFIGAILGGLVMLWALRWFTHRQINSRGDFESRED
ncbi:GlsB/YeaQ/YmgE family stress response membrane protein [Adhaeretor mobilis]|uniref:GlsB/YeaQ/YmgE family stress response membrane protein n=1 Tax=Adhaeretor mobilis TaxID=1930276 RepID=A0A517N0R8_9BACT|nr:GlsB/YeaQ/YmgE family stress response membrane protein [Adhaeretor mobilis]QDT00730.1 hypothetical protein HG15A2_40700 [Adhaeretor mobilis]